MHTIYLRIDEELGVQGMQTLQTELKEIGHITDVEVHQNTPHDILVEFEEDFISPMAILRKLNQHGIHADIMSA